MQLQTISFINRDNSTPSNCGKCYYGAVERCKLAIKKLYTKCDQLKQVIKLNNHQEGELEGLSRH